METGMFDTDAELRRLAIWLANTEFDRDYERAIKDAQEWARRILIAESMR